MPKNLKIVVIILGTLVASFGLYLALQYWSNSGQNANDTDSNGSLASGQVSTRKLASVSNNLIFDFWVNEKTSDIYYVTLNGQIMRLSAGSEQVLSSQAIPELNFILPSADGSAVLIAIGRPQTPTFSVFDTVKRSFTPLPANTTAAAWDPKSNNRIAYLRGGGIVKSLNFFDVSSKKSSELIKLNQNDMVLDWVLPNVIYIRDRYSDKAAGTTATYDIKNKTLDITGEEINTATKWRLDGNYGLKWLNNSLMLIDTNGRVITGIDLKAAPQDCAFSDAFIYCGGAAEQQGASSRNVLTARLKNSSRAQQSIYAIPSFNPTSQSELFATIFFDGNSNETPINPIHLESINKKLLFIDGSSHKLYQLTL